MSRRSDAMVPACPNCGDCLPDAGPDDQVCTCGSQWGDQPLVPTWVPSMRQLIGTLAQLLTNPGPPDFEESA
ncbi:hypothetical protein Ssi03_50850 [Sphaerisporangium siamense]|uniref:Uncharacterized protein n=1 Tax=Sphaerisporangium siamense TaxID=795645 RepID=A0A7W7D8W6_9ACTN|nr:hypothetical protein [Sphaerisporangium siamense]MBB4702211.1 hypothetical protein [Sphaerisporangium siamense]GII87095.1 hypothetical protein Ssi03_50850 [Sphaerisporangium siamense]